MSWCGVVAIDKPAEWTSRQVVDRIAKIVRPAKAGHAGTLDPLATGVLVVAVGPATRLISYLQQGRKRYVGNFRLGQRSNTDDIEGIVVDGGDWMSVSEHEVVQALEPFLGVIQQTPPQFSAVHVDGRRAYSLARKGELVDLQARPVEVFSIELTRFQPPELELEICCGSGTYIRSIGRDLGEALGCGAVMTSLRRLKVGPFDVESALSIEDLDVGSLQTALRPPLDAVADLPRRTITPQEIQSVRQGKIIPAGPIEYPGNSLEVVLVDQNCQLVGISRVVTETACLQPCLILPAAPT